MRVAFLDPLEQRLGEFPQRYLSEHEVLVAPEAGSLPDGVENADAVVWWTYPVDAALIERLSSLRFAQRVGIVRSKGDARAALSKNIPVSVIPLGVSDRVAQHGLALTLAVLRKIVAGHNAVLNGDNPDDLPVSLTGTTPPFVNWARIPDVDTLNDKTVAIIGFGEIGACYSRLLRPFDCRVLYYKRTRLSAPWERYFDIEYAEMDDAIRAADVVIGCLPHGESTRNLIGAHELGLMGPKSIFINVGRGSTVDEAALMETLREHRIGGAGLDVFEYEPLPRSSGLLQLDNVVLAPHTAGGVQGWMNTFERIAANLRRVSEGEPPILPMQPGDPQPGI
ncbi:MAG TPA: NAD(P)-dependent oxidoreductase [Dehalococcoidia bacterium]|nr:NAD(P)-dependent oxidoreductase [Dehalococcoidia bacterium]